MTGQLLWTARAGDPSAFHSTALAGVSVPGCKALALIHADSHKSSWAAFSFPLFSVSQS